MPKVFRPMRIQDGAPAIGTEFAMLGARIPSTDDSSRKCDVRPDEQGHVHPNGGGISVSKSWDVIPPHLVPRRLYSKIEGASASNQRYIWSMGVGDFVETAVSDGLQLRLKAHDVNNGLMEPSVSMHLEEYQSHLAATQPRWSVDEP
jgi:hypothetical protein